MALKKCVITKYDETIQKPPFLTIELDSVEVDDPMLDDGGKEFATRLRAACRTKRYTFKFYTQSRNKNFDYELVTY